MEGRETPNKYFLCYLGALQVNNCFHCYCFVKEELHQDLFVRIITFKFIDLSLFSEDLFS